MSPKAKESVRCFIWLQLLFQWNDVRQRLIKELIKKVEHLARLKEEIHLEAKLLRRNLAEAEAGDSVTDIFDKVTQLRRESVTATTLQFCAAHNHPEVEILTDIILRSADVNMFNSRMLLKHLDVLEGLDKDNCKLKQAKFGAVKSSRKKKPKSTILHQTSKGGGPKSSRIMQQMEVLVAHENDALKRVNLSGTAQTFITKLTSSSRDVTPDPKKRNYNIQMLEFIHSDGDCNSDDPGEQLSTTSPIIKSAKAAPVPELTQQHIHAADTSSTSNTGNTSQPVAEIERYNDAFVKRELIAERREENATNLCAEESAIAINFLTQNSMKDEPSTIPEKIARIFNDNLVIEDGVKWIKIGPKNTKLRKSELCEIDWTKSGPLITRELLLKFLGYEKLAAHSLSTKTTLALVQKPILQELKLNASIVSDLIHFMKLTKGLSLNDIRNEMSKKKREGKM